MLDAIGSVLTSSGYEALVYCFVTIGVWLELRILDFPDLTVDGSFVTGGSIAAVMLVSGFDPFLATFCALLGGMFAGLITGLLHTKLRITALLAGILMMVGLWSVNLVIMMGRANIPLLRTPTVFGDVADFFGTSQSAFVEIAFVAAIAIAVIWILNWFFHTDTGLAMRATGDNEQMIRGLGSNTDTNILIGTSLGNGLVALSGALASQGQAFCAVNMGVGMIVMGLAAVIVGEALFRPHGVMFALLAMVGGTFVYRLFLTVALRAGMPAMYLKLITAVLVIIALAGPLLRKKLRGEWVPRAGRF
ncbi:MAG: ABC transporter permease [Chloroflexota bacterium]